jgi:glycogen operon protein
VSYESKHNEANGEDNRDGCNHNDSWNCGIEGPTDDAGIKVVRARQQKNFLTTLLLSQGVPMLLAGDEFGHTQRGNNNAYCQDSPIAWLDWNLSAEQVALLKFTREVVRLRKSQPVFRRRHFFQGRPIHGEEIKDLYWLKPDGTEMTDGDWNTSHARCLGLALPGDQINEIGDKGERIFGDTFAILLNCHSEPISFRIGTRRRQVRWVCVLDTAEVDATPRAFDHSGDFPLQAHSMVVLRANLISTQSSE